MSSLFFGILCCFLVYGVGLLCFNSAVGLISVFLLLINPIFVDAASRSMTDIFYLFFLLCCLFSLVLFHKKRKLLVVALGIFSALAASVKITGILVGSFILICNLIVNERHRLNRYPIRILLFGVSATLVIYLLNPFLWISFASFKPKAFLTETKLLVEHVKQKMNGDEISIQIRNYPQLEPFLKLPYIFLEWNYVMKEQQENIASGKWNLNPQRFGMTIDDQVLRQDASRLLKINEHFFYLHSSFPFIQIPFFFLGILFCLIDLKKKASQKQVSIYVAPFLFFFANYIFILFTMKLNWDRYFLTTVAAAQMLTAIGIVSIGKNLFAKLMGIRKSLTERTGVYDR